MLSARANQICMWLSSQLGVRASESRAEFRLFVGRKMASYHLPCTNYNALYKISLILRKMCVVLEILFHVIVITIASCVSSLGHISVVSFSIIFVVCQWCSFRSKLNCIAAYFL